MSAAWPSGGQPRSRQQPDWSGRALTAVAGVHPAHAAAIAQSHERCQALGLSRIEAPDPDPLGRSDLTVALDRHRRLCAHAAPVMAMLHQQIVNTGSMVALTDATGTILHSIGDDDFLSQASKVALQPGANWSEPSKGTNAVGTALIDERPTLVHADEHYMHANHFLTCSAAPILDPHGNILGALDVSGNQRSFHPHTMALVTMSVRMIENHWLTDDAAHAVRVHFHPRVDHIGSLLEGILTLAADGRVTGANRSAMELLGLSGVALRHQSLRSLFGLSLDALYDQAASALALPLTVLTEDGQPFHLHAHCHRTVRAAVSLNAPAAPTLHHAAGSPAPVRPATPAVRSPSGLAEWLTGDTDLHSLVDRVRRVLDLDISLLLCGETGTGKQWLARAIHAESGRAHLPFVHVNCAGLSEAALEAELLGQAPGPFAAARRQVALGKLEQAQGGTLFLDQIGDMPPGFQARWLRLLQARQFSPVGSDRTVALQATIICAHRTPLRTLIDRGLFRDDLYYQINGLSLRLPPLRERSDVLALARRLLAQQLGPSAPPLSAAAQDLLQRAPWPGNVRQLSNALRSAAVMAAGLAAIDLAHFPDDLRDEARGVGWSPANTEPVARPAELDPTTPQALPQVPGRAEPALPLEQVLSLAGGNVSEAARRLGLSRNTLYRKLRQLRRP